MNKILLLIVLFVGVNGFSQSTLRYRVSDNGPKPSDFYMIMFEVKDFVVTSQNVGMLNNVDLKGLCSKRYEDQDLEIFIEDIQKTIIIYSAVKAEGLMEIHYNHSVNFVPLYN